MVKYFAAESSREEATSSVGCVTALDALAEGPDLNLWLRHLHMGIASFVVGGTFLLAYLAITPNGPHRTAITAVDLAAIAGSIIIIGPVGRMSLTTPWRDAFFFTWSFGTIVIIAVGLNLDGGAGSPIAGLLVLPVLFGGLLYNLREVIALAALTLATFVLVFLTGPQMNGGRALATVVMIGIAGGISVTATMNRSRSEQDRRVLIEHLHRLATYDGLTGCLSYQAFQEALATESEKARRYGHPFSLVIADLDDFKTVNDCHGHGVGDSTLTTIAAEMLAGVRSVDLIGRIGGDEFAVLLPETSSQDAEWLVERIRSRTLSAVTPQSVTLSFGLSTWSGPSDSPSELLRRGRCPVRGET